MLVEEFDVTVGGADQIAWFEDIGRNDVALVGGKNASLGEMVRSLRGQGIRVPPGFATTADVYRRFVEMNGLQAPLEKALGELQANKTSLAEAGAFIRQAFMRGDWPDETAATFKSAYRDLCTRVGFADAAVAVRSSATAEDLPDASFAGQQETFLNITGEEALLEACRCCFASLFTDRAISYREAKGFDHMKVALSVGVQLMVNANHGGAGVMFSIDTETGFDRIVLINAVWGLGENVVQGTVDPDEYQVYKPLLSDPKLVPIIEKKLGEKAHKMLTGKKSHEPTQNVSTSLAERNSFVLDDADILQLARSACSIETHYGVPMDMEWVKDGRSGELFIVQARSETVQSRKQPSAFKSYRIESTGEKLASGLAIGDAIVHGNVCLIHSPDEIGRFEAGAILVTETTDPDWVPLMKRAAAIVTDHGGRTSHAAIVSRELGVAAVIGVGDATEVLHEGQEVTVSCAEGDIGFIYDGKAEYEVNEVDVNRIPRTCTKVMLNLANPAAAFRWWRLPADGVGLTRLEFLINNAIKIHPMALVQYDTLQDTQDKKIIAELTHGYTDKAQYFVDRLSRGLAKIAAAFYPNPVIIRFSDFKSNEYAKLLGGEAFEIGEENPMIGFRGASRYYSVRYREGFALECQAIRRLRDDLGFKNVIVMIPFCRSTKEADKVLEIMAANGISRGENGLEVFVMCEIPANVVLARDFCQRFDGFSIGSNDLTQLVLGVDRDSEELSDLFDERDEAVQWMIRTVIAKAHDAGVKVGLCGQAPSDHASFAESLVEYGIDSNSVTPDSFMEVKKHIAAAEGNMRRGAEPIIR